MPSDKIVYHPDGKTIITFNEDAHSYIDNFGKIYRSVTTLIGKSFKEFDVDAISIKCASKYGMTPEDLAEKWKKDGKEAARKGTRLHENCENQILGKIENIHLPEDVMERIKFKYIKKIVDGMITLYGRENMEPEKLIFSPMYGISGTIDLLVKLTDNKYIIYDWKVLKKDLSKTSFNNEMGLNNLTKNIPNSNFWHYALQQQTYELILKNDGYINADAVVKRILVVWNGNTFNRVELPYLEQLTSLSCWN